jgi:hypothetical protein
MANKAIFWTSLIFGLLMLAFAYTLTRPTALPRQLPEPDNPFKYIDVNRVRDAFRLYDDLITKREVELLALSSSNDPCSLTDCKGFSSDIVRRIAEYALKHKPEHDKEVREDFNTYLISTGSLVVSFMSFTITFLSFWRGRENKKKVKVTKKKRA